MKNDKWKMISENREVKNDKWKMISENREVKNDKWKMIKMISEKWYKIKCIYIIINFTNKYKQTYI